MSNRNKHNRKFVPTRPHMDIPEVEVKKVKEPRPVCSICGEPIESIIEAITESDGNYSHFDCVIDKIKNEYKVSENEKVSYIGQGNFAVFVIDEEGKFTIKEKITYESANSFDSMKKFVEENRE